MSKQKNVILLFTASFLFALAGSCFAMDPAEEQFYKTFGQLKTVVKPRPQDEKANQIAKKQLEGKDAPMPVTGKNGSVQYQYGTSVPRILCKPLRVTDIELEPGESIVNTPFIGDSVNWSVMPSASGSGNKLTYHIIIKPNMPDIQTNLLVHTDRRTYEFDLVSSTKMYTPRVSFVYPDTIDHSWDNFFTAIGRDPRKNLIQKEQEVYGTELPAGRPDSRVYGENKKSGSGYVKVATPKTSSRLNFNYTITPRQKNIDWKPLRVYDDGVKTYIDMPDNLASIEAPIFMLLSPAGSREMVNYRLVDRTYVVDRLVKKGVLIAGTGHDSREVVIANRGTATAAAGNSTADNDQKVIKTKDDLIKYLSNE